MTLEEYTGVGDKDTFCYWLEFGSEELGSIKGTPSNKFGIWKRKVNNQIVSVDLLFNASYAWQKKYGNTPEEAFQTVRSLIVYIIQNAQSGDFKEIDGIDLHIWTKWKIAFIYSNYHLLPIYEKQSVRKIAEYFKHPNYRKARFSELRTYIIKQKAPTEDFFEFALTCYKIATQNIERNYYIIGSKYEDEDGKDSLDVFPYMLKKSAISTGFFWNYNFEHLIGSSFNEIDKWIIKNIPTKSEKNFDNAKKTMKYFLNLKPGDIIAVKSHGRYGSLTIIAYAQVIEKDGRIYEYGDKHLGHLINVDFLETDLQIKTGLTYALTIHKIIPNENADHFQKVFGSFAFADRSDSTGGDENDFEDELKEKPISPYTRSVSAKQTVTQVHSNIQIEFSKYLKHNFPKDTIKVEKKRIDILRYNKKNLFIYEIKPYNSAFYCIREGLGQLLDYCFSDKRKINKHLVIVGLALPNKKDLQFIDFVKSSLTKNFCYEYFDLPNNTSTQF